MPTIYIENKDVLPGRREHDFYPTPMEFCRAATSQILPKDFNPDTILDPGMGDGVWGAIVRELYSPDALLIGCDIRDVGDNLIYNICFTGEEAGDFLKWADKPHRYDLIIGNPPYKLAEEFLDISFNLLEEGGYILFLLNLAFQEGQGRFKKYFGNGLNPKEVWVSTRRISFSGDRKSNANGYACYVWQKGFTGNTTLKWLDWNYD